MRYSASKEVHIILNKFRSLSKLKGIQCFSCTAARNIKDRKYEKKKGHCTLITKCVVEMKENQLKAWELTR